MNVELLTRTEHIAGMERVAALAALTCRGNADKEFVPAEVLGRIIKAGHESILEHINLTYSVKGLSRACLQELARHRHISLSVESTRHTLRKYLLQEEFHHYSVREITVTNEDTGERFNLLDRYFTVLGDIAESNPEMLNDELKYYLPEFWPTNLVLTSNVRELRHILKLRTAPAALKEFRELARAMYEAVPEQYKYLLKDCVHEEAANE